MLDTTDLAGYRGARVIDADGNKVGKLEEIYFDDHTGRPEWALVHTGLFGGKSTFVPLAEADASGDDIRVPYPKAKVSDAPRMDAEGHLEASEERELYEYYGLSYEKEDAGREQVANPGAGMAGTQTSEGESGPETQGRDVSGRTTEDATTRSEERPRGGTTSQEPGRARLRKYIVTENVTIPVSHEEFRVEREPITEASRGDSGQEASEEEHEVVLHQEAPVAQKDDMDQPGTRDGR